MRMRLFGCVPGARSQLRPARRLAIASTEAVIERQNSSLHIIAIGRLWTDPRTKAYMAKRIAEGHSKLEIIRCLKRYIAREARPASPCSLH
jgi:hypothetical protein